MAIFASLSRRCASLLLLILTKQGRCDTVDLTACSSVVRTVGLYPTSRPFESDHADLLLPGVHGNVMDVEAHSESMKRQRRKPENTSPATRIWLM